MTNEVETNELETKWHNMLRLAHQDVKDDIVFEATKMVTPEGLTPHEYAYLCGARDVFIELRKMMEMTNENIEP